MKTVAALIAGLLLGTAGIAGASSSSTQDIHNNGVWCKPGAGGVACVVEGGRYGVGVHRSFVLVSDMDRGNRIIFKRYQ